MATCWLELYDGTLRTPRMAMGTSPKERRSKYMPLTTEGRLSFRKGSSSALMMLQGHPKCLTDVLAVGTFQASRKTTNCHPLT